MSNDQSFISVVTALDLSQMFDTVICVFLLWLTSTCIGLSGEELPCLNLSFLSEQNLFVFEPHVSTVTYIVF